MKEKHPLVQFFGSEMRIFASFKLDITTARSFELVMIILLFSASGGMPRRTIWNQLPNVNFYNYTQPLEQQIGVKVGQIQDRKYRAFP